MLTACSPSATPGGEEAEKKRLAREADGGGGYDDEDDDAWFAAEKKVRARRSARLFGRFCLFDARLPLLSSAVLTDRPTFRKPA